MGCPESGLFWLLPARPCYTNSMLKQLGLISILIMWAGTYILLRRHLPDAGKTISQHASKSNRYHIAYGALELFVVSLFSLFIFGWFIPTFQLGIAYGAAAIIGFTGTVIAAFFPDRVGWQGRIHGFGAYGMAMALLAMNFILLQSPKIHLITQIALYAGITYMVVGTITALVNTPLYRRNALKLQVIYFIAFQIPLLLAAHS